MNLTLVDKTLFLPVAFIGCLICAFPVLVIIPTTKIHTALTGTVNLFVVDGILAWLFIAGFFALLTLSRIFYIWFRLRPFQKIHSIYFVLSFFQIIAYIMVVIGPVSGLDFFLNNATSCRCELNRRLS